MMQENQRQARVVRYLICTVLLACLQGSWVSAQNLINDWSWLSEDNSTYRSSEIVVQFQSSALAINVSGPRTRQSILTEACETILPGSQVKQMLGQIIPNLAVA